MVIMDFSIVIDNIVIITLISWDLESGKRACIEEEFKLRLLNSFL